MGSAALGARARALLDLGRASAAGYVVAHHVTQHRSAPVLVRHLFHYGQEAVIVFFLISGFVIFANEQSRALRPRGYYLRRLRRIYPPLLAAAAVSAGVVALDGHLQRDFHWSQLAATLFSVQDLSASKPGVIANPFLGNAPLWSLSYEVVFYLAFPPLLRLWRRDQSWATAAIGMLSLLSYVVYLAVPNHFSLVAAYLMIWWTGAMCAHAYLTGELRVRRVWQELLWLSALTLAALAGVEVKGSAGFSLFPLLMVRHFVVALAIVVFTIWFRAPLGGLALRLRRPAALAASVSYGVYVLHFPLLITWTWSRSTGGLLGAVALLLVLSALVERGLARVLPRAPRD